MKALYLTPNIETVRYPVDTGAASSTMLFTEALAELVASADVEPVSSLRPLSIELMISVAQRHVASQYEHLVQTLTGLDVDRSRAIYAILHDVERSQDIVRQLHHAYELAGGRAGYREMASGQKEAATKAIRSLALRPLDDLPTHMAVANAVERMVVVLARSLPYIRTMEPARPPQDESAPEPNDRCPLCPGGTISSVKAAGRTFLGFNGTPLPIPDDRSILTCDNCGVQWISAEDAEMLTQLEERLVKP